MANGELVIRQSGLIKSMRYKTIQQWFNQSLFILGAGTILG